MTIERILAWAKGLEPIGKIHTIGTDCYWNDVTGVVHTFNKVKKQDIVISPNYNQGCAHIYRIVDCVPLPETALGPFTAHVKLIDVMPQSSLEEFKNNLTKYPYL